MKMINIAIIPPNTLPIPNIKGGAIETLTTSLIIQNEKNEKCHMYIYNGDKYETELKKYKYKNSTIKIIKSKCYDRIFDFGWLIIRKIFRYRVPYCNSFINRVCKEIKKDGIDYILVEGNPHYVWKISKVTGIKPCLHIHTDHVLDEQTRSYSQIIENCDKIICVSKYIKNQIAKIKNIDLQKLCVCLNCTDLDKFNPKSREMHREQIRKKLGIKSSDIVFTFVGRVDPMKGVGELLEAFKKCSVENKKLLIVGGNNFGDSIETDFFKFLKNEEKLSSGKIILTGFIDRKKLPEYYSAADIYVSPSKYDEAAPLANIEAMSMGLTCIVSNKGGTLEYTDKNCIVVDVNNNAVNNIVYAMNNAPLLDRKKDGGVNNKWSVERYYQDMILFLLHSRDVI